MAAASEYRPPLDDYAFLFAEAFGIDIVARATGGELSAADANEVVSAAGELAAGVFAPLNTIGDEIGPRLEDGQVHVPDGFADAYRAFAEAGWVTAEAPASAGGDGLPGAVRVALGELWASSNTAFSLCWMLSLGQVHALDALASDAIRETYLSRLVSGEWTGTMNLTEPQAGTDLGAIRTTATPQPDGTWRISGQKIFITWGDHDLTDNIVHLVLARTPGAPAGAKGLSLFVVPKVLVNADGTLGERNAVTTVAIEHKLGIHGSPTCVLAYEDATGHLVGEVGGGLAGMFVMMNQERIGVGLEGTALGERALQQAADYAAARLQGPVLARPAGTPIAEHPDVRRLLLSMRSQVFASRALGVLVGDLFDRAGSDGTGALAELLVPVLKGWSTEQAQLVASDGIQVHGGMGFVEETGAAQHYRDARITTIYEGTTAIQSNDLIGRKLLRNHGATAEELFGRIEETSARLRETTDAVARRTADRLERAVEASRRATSVLLGFASSPRDAHAVSVPYLMLLGTLAGGWMHGLAVAAVLRHPELSGTDAGRLTAADFYGAHHLPRVHALAETVAAGEIA